jgi:hypothetical protein
MAGVESVFDVMKAGQALTTLPIWKKKHKLVVMTEIVTSKLHFCGGFRKYLCDSGDDILEEETAHHFWGALWNQKFEKYGDNQLGRIHMELRERSRLHFGRYEAFRPMTSFRPVPVGVPPYVAFRDIAYDCGVSESVLLRLDGVPGWEVRRM